MFTIGGATYGLLNPAYSMLLPVALGALVYAYRRGGRSKELIVSTVMFLKKLTTQTRARRKFVPPLRFFFELLLLILLIAAASGLYRKGFSDSVAILIDNSFSMSSNTTVNSKEMTLLDVAKRDATTYANGLSFGIGVEVFVTSPQLRSLSAAPVSISEARAIIDNIEFSYAADNLDSALTTIGSNKDYKNIAIFSTAIPATDISTTKFLYRSSEDIVGKKENIAVTSARISLATDSYNKIALAEPDPSRSAKLVNVGITVAGFTAGETTLNLKITAHDNINGRDMFSELKNESVTLIAREVKNVAYDVPQASGYIFTISENSNGSGPARDSNTNDNAAYLSLAEKKDNITLVSAISPTELGLKKLPNYTFDWVKPDEYSEEYSGKKEVEDSKSLFTIFHNIVPTISPQGNALFINPNADGPFFTSNNESSTEGARVEITSWDETHPISTYLNLPILNFKSVSALSPTNGARSIIGTSSGGVVIAQDSKSNRSVALGFELLPFKGKRSPLLSILTLNIFKWIVSTDLEKGYETIPFDTSKEKVQKIGVIRSAQDDYIFNENIAENITVPGLYRFILKNGDTKTKALNFLSDTESDLLTTQTFSVPELKSSVDITKSKSNSFVKNILLIVLVLLLLDLLFGITKNLLKQRRAV